jgi:hypothetical protein
MHKLGLQAVGLGVGEILAALRRVGAGSAGVPKASVGAMVGVTVIVRSAVGLDVKGKSEADAGLQPTRITRPSKQASAAIRERAVMGPAYPQV